MKVKFDFDSPFTIEFTGGYKAVTNIVFCDYTRTALIRQNGVEFRVQVGYVGRDLSKTKRRYLFTDDRIYQFDEDDYTRDVFDTITTTSGFPSWLIY